MSKENISTPMFLGVLEMCSLVIDIAQPALTYPRTTASTHASTHARAKIRTQCKFAMHAIIVSSLPGGDITSRRRRVL